MTVRRRSVRAAAAAPALTSVIETGAGRAGVKRRAIFLAAVAMIAVVPPASAQTSTLRRTIVGCTTADQAVALDRALAAEDQAAFQALLGEGKCYVVGTKGTAYAEIQDAGDLALISIQAEDRRVLDLWVPRYALTLP
jgi:hypothetical protein